ncbi:MAG: hypothetical protein UR61_C0066G0003 [candidate division WS6 bacterium GW2011_GWE1_34_7]|uniref:Yip1 domain-containing protein n=1 Tax=candidate division WS6 bacterium GW2011_GWE1_34_7 TaxID=1619093 RepID=A0A0G0B2W4_9BACT|nr:MAG: hypothetical protein UR61_C0066G0003 [candidate division WS6 bacterium GW2011_GWE1_34_7]
MKNKRVLFFTLLLTVLLLPVGYTYAQEDNIPPEEDETLMYESAPLTDEMIPYEELENDIVYDLDTVQDEAVVDGVLAAMMGYIAVVSLFGLAGYIFMSLALQKIGQEMKYENSWFAWVPILQNVMMFELGEQNPWLLLLFLIPGIGQIVVLIFTLLALMNITEKRGYDKVLAILIFVPFAMYVLFYLLAWKPKEVVATTTPTQPIPETK